MVAEADGRFGIWVPNLTWTAVQPLPAGHLALRCEVHGAEVRLSLLDHLEAGTMLDTATDAVANWLGLLYPQLQVQGRRRVQVRGRSAMRMQAADPRARERATVDVVVEVCEMMAPGHVSLPNGTGVDYMDVDGTIHHRGVAPNELTDSYRRDFLAGTPWHKHIPVRLEKVSVQASLE